MKLNTYMSRKIIKGLAAAGLFLCLLLTAVPAFAEEPTAPASQTETVTETETKEDESKPEEKESSDEIEILPGGNLTLIDDVITADEGHREFLTVVSKDGSYFYIVVDRDTPGAGNVYFLNLVDNQDLYKLTGEKAPEVKEPETEEKPAFVPQKQEPEDMEPDPAQTEEETAEQKRRSLMITVGFGAAIIVGVIIYLLKKKKNKKAAQVEYDLSDYEDDDEE